MQQRDKFDELFNELLKRNAHNFQAIRGFVRHAKKLKRMEPKYQNIDQSAP